MLRTPAKPTTPSGNTPANTTLDIEKILNERVSASLKNLKEAYDNLSIKGQNTVAPFIESICKDFGIDSDTVFL